MVNNNVERRSLVTTNIQARSANGKKILSGRAAAYNTISHDLGGFRELLAPGTFSRAVREKDDCIFCLNHDDDALPLGRVSAGTLELSEDQNGLNFVCYLPNSQAARDLYESVQRRDIHECSFKFAVPDGGDDWNDAVDGNGRKFILRTVRTVKPLWDVSAVLHPAYPSGTNVSADMLAGTSAARLKVSARALAECRRRGGVAPKARVVLVDDEDRDWIRRESARKVAAIIAAEEKQ